MPAISVTSSAPAGDDKADAVSGRMQMSCCGESMRATTAFELVRLCNKDGNNENENPEHSKEFCHSL